MNCFSRTVLLIALTLFSSVSLRASPDYPFEGLLPRAKVIFTGRVLTHDDLHVTFAVSESLRGQTETRLTFGYSSVDDKALASALLTPVAAQHSSPPDYTHVTITMK